MEKLCQWLLAREYYFINTTLRTAMGPWKLWVGTLLLTSVEKREAEKLYPFVADEGYRHPFLGALVDIQAFLIKVAKGSGG